MEAAAYARMVTPPYRGLFLTLAVWRRQQLASQRGRASASGAGAGQGKGVVVLVLPIASPSLPPIVIVHQHGGRWGPAIVSTTPLPHMDTLARSRSPGQLSLHYRSFFRCLVFWLAIEGPKFSSL